jgi:hypothetical protein
MRRTLLHDELYLALKPDGRLYVMDASDGEHEISVEQPEAYPLSWSSDVR